MARRRRRVGRVTIQLSFDDLAPSYVEKVPSNRGYYVYRIWAAGESCLYVGMVGRFRPSSVESRLRQHRYRHKPGWWTRVVRIDVAEFSTSADAALEERYQIGIQCPVYNKLLYASNAVA
jgi:hypothetical protein